ncbi:hypothetical protein P171DRAFT_100866 [Karstenula rhodostoma CBS 690.94]|uniref:Uncharacterized protein n=1 Tax=Karstenula rhodostoma CBS 690.94 TaxID=1392251 RepID=A0A9P4PC98_9PLEO|nr:hypothetical protein P171DRAFT_100866 [Karstenula rhodostoma CBS 690.94]
MFIRLRTFLRDMWVEARQDVCSIRWRTALLWRLPITIWTLGLPVLLIFLCLIKYIIGVSDIACTPGGQFSLVPYHYNYWSTESVFQITLAFGELSFGVAKFIDIAWDVVFGRIGQLVLVLFSSHVFSIYVTASMETAPITYNSYRAIFLEPNPSFWSTVALIRDFTSRRSLHSNLAMVFMVATMTFTIAFPTLASAMTGYTSAQKAYVPDHQNGNMIRFDNFGLLLYTIHDGERVGLTNEYLVTTGKTGDPIIPKYGYMLHTHTACSAFRFAAGYTTPDFNSSVLNAAASAFELDNNCLLQNNVTAYVGQYRFNGSSNSQSTFMNHQLDAPTLNISAASFNDYTLFGFSHVTLDPRNMLWVWSNDTYNETYLTQKGTCQASGV